MSAPPPEPEQPEEADAAVQPTAKGRRRRRWGLWLAGVAAVLVAMLVGLLGGARLAVRTDGGRRLVARLLEGLPLGPVGHLHVEGIGGDPLRDLKIARLEIIDAKGAWLDARDLEMRWRYAELFHRRFHAQALAARILVLIRDPVLAPAAPSKGASKLPIAVQIDSLKLRLESRPAFSVQRGVYDIDAALALERNMAASGRLAARSQLHAGDGVAATFQVGQGGRVAIRADAVEGRGGALAGALGLAVDQPLNVRLRADGSVDAGALTLRTASGAGQPLQADAVWGSGGAHLTAALALGASRLTRDLAARAGPIARLTLQARHLQRDTFQLQGQLTGDTASVAIAGPLDWKVRDTSGLDLDVKVADAARWAPGVPIGSARLTGRLVGDPERFDFKGRLAAARVGPEAGYTLARAEGLVGLSRRKDDWEVTADLAGAAGAGKGLVAGLLGAQPRVKLAAAHLPDGRWLVRSLDAHGAGAALTGEGGQGLFGGLTFKGSAALADAGVLQHGMRGRLQAAWTAAEPKGASAWRFGLDARGQGFSSGVAAADHFLGPSPGLKADASWGGGGLQVASATLTGAAAQVSGHGRLEPKGALGFDLAWSAQGPFDAGPLRIAGQATGGGHVGGVVSAPAISLETQVASLALGKLIVRPAHLNLTLAKAGDALAGQVALGGPSAYGSASLKAAYRVAGGEVVVHDLEADAGGVRASGSLTLANGAPSLADLALQVRSGAFLDAGRLDGTLRLAQTAGGLAAHVAVTGEGVAAPGAPVVVRRLSLKADGPYDHLPLQLAVDAGGANPFSFDGTGRLDQAGAARQLTLEGAGKVRKIGFRTVRPALVRLDGDARQLDLGLAVGGGRIDVAARTAGDALTATAKLAGVDLTTLDPDYDGAVDATLNLNGHGAVLGGALDATLAGARSRDAPANLALAGRVHADLAGDRLRLTANATNAQGLSSSLDVDLPAIASASPVRLSIDRTRPMRGQFSADGELRPLWDLLVGGDQRLSGHVSAAGQLAGDLNRPKVLGHAAISSGRYQNYAVGLDLQAFAVRADFGQDAVKVEQVSGTDGRGGVLSGSGDIALASNGASSFVMRIKKFRVIDNDTATAVMSGDATVTRDAKGQAKLVGALTVDRADIAPNTPTPNGVVNMDVVEINKPGEENPLPSQAAAKAPSVAPPVLLDVRVRAPRGVFVKGKGLNVELALDAHVTGSASAPDLKGEARVVLGSYDFAGKRFDFDGRSVIHLGTRPEDIRLDLTATRQNTTSSTSAAATKATSATVETSATSTPSANAALTAEVHVTGTAARPVITLTSTPVLPQDEVLSQVLFGSSAAQLTAAQAAELASTLASLSGGGGFDVLGRLRQFAGLDRLAFGQGASGTGVSGGKYVSDNVYVELTGGGREGPSAAVEWRVLPTFSIISRVGAQGDAQLSIQWNKTFR